MKVYNEFVGEGKGIFMSCLNFFKRCTSLKILYIKKKSLEIFI